MATVKIEGQEIELPDEIAGDDDRLRQALRDHFPQVGNAAITRTKENGREIITIAKQAGQKGHTVLTALLTAPAYRNPAIALACRLAAYDATHPLDLDSLLTMQPAIDEAITAGETDAAAIERTLRTLHLATALHSRTIPHGF